MGGEKVLSNRKKEKGNGRRKVEAGTLLTLFLSLSLGLGSASTHCLLCPCCHLGSLPEELPSFASFTPPFAPSLPSDWTCLSGPFLPPLLPEHQFPGSSKTDTLLPGPMCPPAAWYFPWLPCWLRWDRGLVRGSGSCLLGQRCWE